MEEYISVNKETEAEITEKKSRFIAYIKHVETEDDAALFINSIKKKNYDAKHNVFAYILKNGKKKYSDDGEPSKTAGFPILDMLEKEKVTDVVCVVTRYFGGTLLGVGGLIRAYTKAAKDCLKNAEVTHQRLCSVLKITSDYAFLEQIKHILKSKTAVLSDIEYTDKAAIYIIIPEEDEDLIKNSISDEIGNAASFEKIKNTYYAI